MTPDREAGPSSTPSSPRRYEARPVFAMVPLSQITPSTMPDLSPIVRQSIAPGTPYQSHSRKHYYAVARGHIRTIVATWEEAQLLIRDYHNPLYRSFMKFREAVRYMAGEDDVSEE